MPEQRSHKIASSGTELERLSSAGVTGNPGCCPANDAAPDGATAATTLRFTITGTYEADPAHYEGADTPEAMAALDQDEIDSGSVGPGEVIEWAASARDLSVRIEVASVTAARSCGCARCRMRRRPDWLLSLPFVWRYYRWRYSREFA